MFHKLMSIFLTSVVILNLLSPVYAAESTARVITIFSVSGDDVTMTKGTEKEFKAREGLGLFDGYTVSTGKESNCYLKMDEDSLLTMDQKSKIQVSKKSSSKLSVSVLSGTVSVNAGKQKDGNTLEVGAGNSAMTIRGTLFLAGYEQNGIFSIFMLTGSGEVDGITVSAGSKMLVSDILEDKEYQLQRIVLETEANPFLLQTIIENKEEVLETGIFSEEDIEKALDILNNMEKQPEPPPEENAHETVEYFREPDKTIPNTDSDNSTSKPSVPPPTPNPPPNPSPSISDRINSAANGTLHITANETLNSSAVINPGVTLVIEAGTVFNINSTLTNQGTIINYGTINNNTSTSLHNYGTFDNYSIFNNTTNGAYHHYAAASLLNSGSVFIQGGTFQLAEPIIGTDGATITYTSGSLSGEGFNSLSNFYDSLDRPITQSGITVTQYRWNSSAHSNKGGWVDTAPPPARTYTVAYNLNGGSGTLPGAVQAAQGGSFTVAGASGITPPGGKVFNGWNTSANGSGMNYFPGTIVTVTGDMTLYAVWSDLPVYTYTLSYNLNGGTGTLPNSVQIASGGSLTVSGVSGLTPPGGKTFREWNTAANGGGLSYLPGTVITVTGNMTLYAIWSNLPAYTVAYNLNGGTGSLPGSLQITSGSSLMILDPAGLTPPADKMFKEWNTAANGGGKSYSPGTLVTVTDNMTLYAIWINLPVYTVTYDLNGGTDPAPSSLDVVQGRSFTVAGILGVTPPAGKMFKEWNTSADGGGASYTPGNDVVVTAPMTLYAIWEDLLFTFTENNGELTITGYTGSIALGLKIPGSINGMPVVAIGDNAFKGRSTIRGNVTIPDSVTSIGNEAFSGCSRLTGGLTIPDSVISIGYEAFSNCSGLTGSLTIGDSVTSIGGGAFSGSGFTGSLTIPDSVISIGGGAFNGCGFTGNLTIGDSVTSIEDWTFSGTGFTGNLTIPDSVISIGEGAFLYCSGFTGSLIIPSSVTSIGDEAFYECHNLDDTYFLGNAPTVLGTNIFSYMKHNFTIYYFSGTGGWPVDPSHTDSYPQVPIYTVTYDLNGGTGSLPSAVQIASGSSLIISDISGFIPPADRPLLKEWNTAADGSGTAYAPETVAVVTADMTLYAIWTDDVFTFDEINGELTITGYTGSVNVGLKIPSSIDGKPVVAIADNAFKDRLDIIGILTIPDSVRSIGNFAFSGSALSGSLTIPASVRIIGDSAFSGCNSLDDAYFLGNAPTTLGTAIFDSMDPGFTIYYFSGTDGWPVDQSHAGSYPQVPIYTATYNLNGGSGTLPAAVKTVQGDSFTLADIYAITPPAGKYFTEWNTAPNGTGTGYSPGDAVTAASNMTLYAIWSEVFFSVTENNGELTITDCLSSAITVLHIPSHIGGKPVVAIGDSAFRFRSDIKGSLIIPDTVRSIGDFAFQFCSGLSGDLRIPNSVTSIGWAAFSYSGFNGELTLSDSLTFIGDTAFNECSGLKGDLIIPNSVTFIGDGAFYGCTGFNGILSIGHSVTSIGMGAFYGCNGFDGEVFIPGSVVSIGYSAFEKSGFNNARFLGDVPTTMGTPIFANMKSDFIIYYLSGAKGWPMDTSYAGSYTQVSLDSITYNLKNKTGYLPGAVQAAQSYDRGFAVGNTANITPPLSVSSRIGLGAITAYTEQSPPIPAPLSETVFFTDNYGVQIPAYNNAGEAYEDYNFQHIVYDENGISYIIDEGNIAWPVVDRRTGSNVPVTELIPFMFYGDKAWIVDENKAAHPLNEGSYAYDDIPWFVESKGKAFAKNADNTWSEVELGRTLGKVKFNGAQREVIEVNILDSGTQAVLAVQKFEGKKYSENDIEVKLIKGGTYDLQVKVFRHTMWTFGNVQVDDEDYLIDEAVIEGDLVDGKLINAGIIMLYAGDIDGDNGVNAFDILSLNSYLNQLASSSDNAFKRDVDGDGKVSYFDSLIISANYNKRSSTTNYSK